jgi:hypothetical protein
MEAIALTASITMGLLWSIYHHTQILEANLAAEHLWKGTE